MTMIWLIRKDRRSMVAHLMKPTWSAWLESKCGKVRWLGEDAEEPPAGSRRCKNCEAAS